MKKNNENIRKLLKNLYIFHKKINLNEELNLILTKKHIKKQKKEKKVKHPSL